MEWWRQVYLLACVVLRMDLNHCSNIIMDQHKKAIQVLGICKQKLTDILREMNAKNAGFSEEKPGIYFMKLRKNFSS